jgi:hypothetical protein
MMRSFFVAAALCCSMWAGTAPAAVLWSFQETSSDVVGSFSGSLDLTGASGAGISNVSQPQMTPTLATIFSGADFTLQVDLYQIVGPTSFGAGGTTLASSASGASLVLGGLNGVVGVPIGYSSGTMIGGQIIFAGATFASLGITPGEYVYALPNDTLAVRFGPAAAIPLPATLPLLLGALGLAALAARGRA